MHTHHTGRPKSSVCEKMATDCHTTNTNTTGNRTHTHTTYARIHKQTHSSEERTKNRESPTSYPVTGANIQSNRGGTPGTERPERSLSQLDYRTAALRIYFRRPLVRFSFAVRRTNWGGARSVFVGKFIVIFGKTKRWPILIHFEFKESIHSVGRPFVE